MESSSTVPRAGWQYYGDQATGSYAQWPQQDWLNVFNGTLSWHICVIFFAEKYVNSNSMYIRTRLNVLIETKQYLVMIRFWFSCQNWHFWILLNLIVFCRLTFMSKTIFFKHVSYKVLRAKWPHGTYGNIRCSWKPGLFNWVCHSNLWFYPTPRFAFSLSN